MQKRYILSALLLASAGLLTTGCGQHSSPAVTEQTPEFSLVIEDTPLDAAETTAPPQTTAAPETTAQQDTTTAPAVSYVQDETLEWNATITAIATIDKDGVYTLKDDVALYIYTYGELPDNFITKKEAQALGWEGGSLEPYAPGKCIGGSYFGNYEGKLPEKEGRTYTECDIGTLGKSKRGAERIVYSNDGLIYYTNDHYNTFELLYGEE